jgi:hypothetical protein
MVGRFWLARDSAGAVVAALVAWAAGAHRSGKERAERHWELLRAERAEDYRMFVWNAENAFHFSKR